MRYLRIDIRERWRPFKRPQAAPRKVSHLIYCICYVTRYIASRPGRIGRSGRTLMTRTRTLVDLIAACRAWDDFRRALADLPQKQKGDA